MIPLLRIEPPMDAREAAQWTTREEQTAAAAFGSARRRAEYLTWRAIVRRELGAQVPIAYDRLGAPVLPGSGLHLSVAHCAGCVAVCISKKRCAVDIEPASRDFSRAASRYMTPSEAVLSNDPLWAGTVWCAKEALYKYAGREGLDFLRDLRVGRMDPAGGTLTGRIGDGEPVSLRVRCQDGFIAVYIL